MMPRHREISVFNLSMLDVIAGAMAAFLILMVILLPYYDQDATDRQAALDAARQRIAVLETALRDARAETAAAQAAAESAQTQAARSAAETASQEQRAETLARQLARTFLVLYIRWDSRDDVDLHVTDPSGAEFWWNGRKTVPGRPGELSEDAIMGPANEVWEIRDAPPGDYRIEANLYTIRDARKPILIQGRVFHRDGSLSFAPAPLSSPNQRARIATIHVDAAGQVSLR